MRVVIQRVKEASVTIEGKINRAIQQGYVLLVGISDEDDEEVAQKVADKIAKLRIFEDDNGKMNRSILDIQGEILSISQFTLFADCNKGNRPSFDGAGKPERAKALYLSFNEMLRKWNIPVQEGIFAADMQVALVNDGPVTILLEK